MLLVGGDSGVERSVGGLRALPAAHAQVAPLQLLEDGEEVLDFFEQVVRNVGDVVVLLEARLAHRDAQQLLPLGSALVLDVQARLLAI